MVKSVLGVSHQGLNEWAIQRVTALIMLIYIIGMVFFFLTHSNLSFQEWHDLFANRSMKVFTVLMLIAIVYHAWAGVWIIFTDYIKPFVLRTFLNLIVLLTLVTSLIWGILIVWSV